MFVPVALLLHLEGAGGQVEERRRLDVLHVLGVDIIHDGRGEETPRPDRASMAEKPQAVSGDVPRLRQPVVAAQLYELAQLRCLQLHDRLNCWGKALKYFIVCVRFNYTTRERLNSGLEEICRTQRTTCLRLEEFSIMLREVHSTRGLR